MKREIVLAQNNRFETERLILQRIVMSDAKDIFEYTSDEETVHYINFPQHKTLEETELAIATEYLRDLSKWGIIEKVSGKLIGAIDLHINGDQGEFTWIINPAFRGKGIIPEAAQVLIQFAFTRLDLSVVTAFHAVENPASGHVMKKVGMIKLGNWYYYAKKYKKSLLCDYYALTQEMYEKLKEEK